MTHASVSFANFVIVTAAVLTLQFVQGMITTVAVVMLTRKQATLDYSAIAITATWGVGNLIVMFAIFFFLFASKSAGQTRVVPVADVAVLSPPFSAGSGR